MTTAEELIDATQESMMTMIEEIRDSEPFGKASPLARDYAMGKFRPVSNQDQSRVVANLIDNDVQNVSENLVGQCLNEISGRLRFDQFTNPDKGAKKYLDAFAARTNLSKALVQVNKRAKTDGNATMSVSWRKGFKGKSGRVVIHHERWWDGTYGVFIHVSDDGTVEWVVADWHHAREKKDRRNIFLPDRILKYRKETEKGWNMLSPEEGGEIDWTRDDGRPLGVPFAHFPNGAPAFGEYGTSTVAQVIPAQDALNASLLNRALVVALTGMQIYWGSGVPEKNEVEVAPGQAWFSTNPAARFGAIPPGDLKALLSETDDLRSTICGEFPVPSYRLGNGDWPSGLALQRSDFPMIASAKLTGDVFEPSVVLLGHRAIELHNHFSDDEEIEESAEAAPIGVTWRPADEVDPGTKVEIDQGTADLYTTLEGLSPTFIRKSGILTEIELKEYLEYRAEQQAIIAEAAQDRDIETGDRESE